MTLVEVLSNMTPREAIYNILFLLIIFVMPVVMFLIFVIQTCLEENDKRRWNKEREERGDQDF